jgi:hypothetical protein
MFFLSYSPINFLTARFGSMWFGAKMEDTGPIPVLHVFVVSCASSLMVERPL